MDRRAGHETTASRRVYSGPVFSVRCDVVRLPDGRRARRDVVEHPGAVVIVPILDRGDLLFVRQYRHAAGEALIEFPAGTIEPGEEPAATAARELREECGLQAGRLTALGAFYSAPGFCSELLHAFTARDLAPAPAAPDPDEQIETVAMPLAQALELAAGGGLRDAKTLAALLLLLRRASIAGPAAAVL
ncbi:MAG TPA: NUDIX hydrolase [Bacillota bacterium]